MLFVLPQKKVADNPMVSIYQAEPEWNNYLMNDKQQKFKTDFWQNEEFGSSILNPIKLKEDNGNVILELENNIESEL